MAKLITDRLGGDEEWLINLNLISQLNAWKFDKDFTQDFQSIRNENKKNFITYLLKDPKYKAILGDFVSGFLEGKEPIMIDVMTKTITFVKR